MRRREIKFNVHRAIAHIAGDYDLLHPYIVTRTRTIFSFYYFAFYYFLAFFSPLSPLFFLLCEFYLGRVSALFFNVEHSLMLATQRLPLFELENTPEAKLRW